MFARTFSASVLGLQGHIISVEIDIANGLPAFELVGCLLYTSPSPRDRQKSRMPSSA